MKAAFQHSPYQTNEEMGVKRGGNSHDAPTDQWAEEQLRHPQRALQIPQAEPRKFVSVKQPLLDPNCFIQAIQAGNNWKFIRQRIFDFKTNAYPSTSLCLTHSSIPDTRPMPMRIKMRIIRCTCAKGNHVWTIILSRLIMLGALQNILTADEIRSFFDQYCVRTVCDTVNCSRPAHILYEDDRTTRKRRACHARVQHQFLPGAEDLMGHPNRMRHSK